ncbi:hypothetical protein XM38_045450 [Halomicronema hongdechloris C2206]|uniref:Fe2OG dioxygenase domain-containing protein n=1 Tax=Halomicronema hongdechloris C2206 TaxID=1641165 RepID=A0A1Z3HTI8_9CYAN|nr:alpha-ketoglutarate-dependent dioxygenase AlkB [Halomicronema hongdechloris]ASC73576.1 hypothetical protein XM38_045450 [Halomicronema hongdechloris C2206]
MSSLLMLNSEPCQRHQLPDGELFYYPQWVSDPPSLFEHLQQTIPWRQDWISLYGKRHPLPRLTAWYGDPGAAYTYSGIAMAPQPWTPTLARLKAALESVAGVPFNSVLLNYYRHGRDSMGWHSDDEPELGPNPVIASLSLGGSRRFVLRHKSKPQLAKLDLTLASGSLLIMAAATQHHWQHRVPKTTKPVAPRINLTFRCIHRQSPENFTD